MGLIVNDDTRPVEEREERLKKAGRVLCIFDPFRQFFLGCVSLYEYYIFEETLQMP